MVSECIVFTNKIVARVARLSHITPYGVALLFTEKMGKRGRICIEKCGDYAPLAPLAPHIRLEGLS